MTKMTYASAIDSALNGVVTDEVRERLEALKAQLVKRNSSERKPTKKQKENEGVMDTICNILAVADAPMTIKALQETEELSEFSFQKLSALLRKLIVDGKVAKTYEKKVAYFTAI